MTNKLISSILLVTSFPFLEAAPSHKDSLLFLFVSNNKIVATIRVAVALILFALSFNYVRITSPNVQKLLFYGGLTITAFGFACFLQPSLGSILYNYVKLLDTMIIIEVGIVFSSTALLAGRVTPNAKVKVAKAKPRKVAPAQQAA